MFFSKVLWGVLILSVESAVLDPALYLSPSPPMTQARGSLTPEEMWTMTAETRVSRDAEEHSTSNDLNYIPATEPSELMENAETFWPSYGARLPARGIHIPLTFSISGSYGNYGGNTGLVGSSYGSVSEDSPFSSYGKAGLAGSSYGSYGAYPGTRIYGNTGGASWSGWGNGKWGHYGKGK